MRKKTENMKLYYVYDALCGWCYGFSPVMQQFYDQHKETLAFEVISGGMITGDRIGPIGEVAGYINEAYKTVEQRTGVKFGAGFLENILKEGKAIFTSIPPSIALTVFKAQLPEHQVAFASGLQKAIYYDGKAPLDYNSYGELASPFGLDADDFVHQMSQPDFEQKTLQEFQVAQQLNVSGFPTIFLEHNNQWVMMARGYVPYDFLQNQYEQAEIYFSKKVANPS